MLNKKGKTALSLAKEQGGKSHADVIHLLEKAADVQLNDIGIMVQ